MWLTLAVLFGFVGLSSEYGRGAPIEVCGDMTPQHHTDPQNSDSPYKLTVEPRKLLAGQEAIVTLSATPGDSFKGFMVQGWKFNENQPAGSFAVTDNSVFQLRNCFGLSGSAITHKDPNEKTRFSATWTAPTNYNGKLKMRATFVRNGKTFWVNQTSEEIEVSGATNIPTAPILPTSVLTAGPNAAVPAGPANPFEKVYEGCFDTKGCFGGPGRCINSKDCTHMVTYKEVNGKFEFEMVGTTRGWLAVGFSTDTQMGGDAVTACYVNGANNRLAVYQSLNFGPTPKGNIALTNPQQGLSNTNATYEDGILYCRFTHEANHIINNQYHFNFINESYYLFLGRGLMESLSPVQMDYHPAIPYVSAEQASLTSVRELGIATNLLIKLHGSLMIAAWIGTVSIAIFLARYYKQMWPGSKHCGQNVWFTWHRMLNIATLLLTVAAFVLIFVQIQGWSQIWKSNPHPILGVVTTVLVVIQPIMAAFRCHPGTAKRPIFNWFHFLVGNSAHIIAVITLFFAEQLPKAQLPSFYMWVLIAFVAYHVVIFFIMEAFTCFHGRKVGDNQIPMKEFSHSNGNSFNLNESREAVGSRFRHYMLLLYIFGNVGFVVALILIVALSPVKER